MSMSNQIYFRQWLQQMWYNHCLEIEEWTGKVPAYDIKVYFAKYKYWLKREFRHQQNVNQ